VTTVPTTLVLVPSAGERAALEGLGGFPGAHARFEACGFGPVAAAARAAELIARLAPARVLLVGIAGTFDLAAAPLGSASAFGRVWQDGVGAGTGEGFMPPSRLGLPQWPGPPPVEDALALSSSGPELLSVCAASASPAEASQRSERYPRCLGEDMEAFAVALACRLACIPCAVVRGFSNPVGVREKRQWRVEEALEAARALALEQLRAPHWEETS
jgi:futalosine hydrolase